MRLHWTFAAAALALAACRTSGSAGQDQAAASAQPAAEQPAAGPQGAPGGVSGDSIEGRVAFVDVTNHEIAIDAGSATTQVRVAPDAKITIDGKQSSFEELPRGADVRVSLDRSGEVPQAREIEVKRSKK